MFDYKEGNMQYYNAVTPPEYDLRQITTPIFLYHASEDLFTSVQVTTA